jgi:PAS domain S-box-containing protein
MSVQTEALGPRLAERPVSKGWRSVLLRYAMAIGILIVILAAQNLLLLYSIKISFTIPIVVGLALAAWYGGRGPGVMLASLIALITAYSSPPAQGTTRGQWLFAHASNLVLMALIVVAVNGRRVFEKRARDAAERYHQLFQYNPLPMWIYDVETLKFLDVNVAAIEKYGYSRDEFLTMTIKEIRPEEEVPVLLENLASPNGDNRWPAHWRHRTKTGKILYVEIMSDGLQYNGRPARRVLVNDITEKTQSKAELRARETELLSIKFALDQSAIVAMTDAAGRINYVNDKFCEMSGYSRDELLGQDHRIVNSGHHPPEFFRDLWTTISAGKVWHGEIRNRTKSGDHQWAETTIVPFLDESGKPYRYVAIRNDITRRKEAEAGLVALNETLELRVAERTRELEAVNRELEAFAYSVSHDLRAPLRAMDGFSLALLEDHSAALDETGKDYLNRVRAASQQMSKLIDDLLGLSRVTRSEIKAEDVDLTGMANEIVSRLRETQPRSSMALDIEDGLTARGDERLLRIALENLIGNAWKFTSKTTEPMISFRSEPSDNGQQVFCVADNGAGFDMTYAGKLFGAFQRLHSASEFEGTGIGLATVQRIVNRHGGSIWAEGEPGNGARFYFSL